jgi:uncharacterized coiled-coil protein SlyX
MEKLTTEQLKALKKDELVQHIESFYEHSEQVSQPADERVVALEAQCAEKDAEILQLNAALAAAENSGSKTDNVIEIAGKKYRMTAAKAKLDDTTVTFDLLQRDQELAEKCVERKGGITW